MIQIFNEENYHTICRLLANDDRQLNSIIEQYGLPPMWTRPANFQTLVLTILEQQVSLASAYAAFKRLTDKTGFVTPEKLLALSDEELRACYFSRQKIIYARLLATAVLDNKINFDRLKSMADNEVRTILKQVKGVGDWTVDVFLIHALQRADIFPLGDIALVNSLKAVLQLDLKTPKEELLQIGERWRPYRTIASMLLWHAYIKRRNIKVYD